MTPETEKWISLCPRCLKEVSNKVYFAGPKGSVHFRGTCEPSTFYPKTIPERTVDKRLPHPSDAAILSHVNYEKAQIGDFFVFTVGQDCHQIETYSDLAKWWGLPTIGEANGNGHKVSKLARVAKAKTSAKSRAAGPLKARSLPPRVGLTLARMGVAI